MIIKVTNTKCYVQKEDRDQQAHFRQLVKHLSTYAPGFQFTKQYKTYKKTKGEHGWNGKVHLFNEGMFSTGLLPRVGEFLKRKTRVTIQDERIQKQVSCAATQVNLRDYQVEAIIAALQNKWSGMWWPRGIIQLATGGGKTEVAAAMIQMLKVPTLFLVDKKSLLYQTAERFSDYGIPTNIIGDGKWESPSTENSVAVATIQTLMSKKTQANPELLSFFDKVEQVFFDESHHIACSIKKGNTFVRLSEMLPYTYMRWGLTATPFMKDEYSNLLLEGATGSVLYVESNDDLIQKEYLTPPKVKMIVTNKDESVPNAWPDCYTMGIVHNKERNNRICQETLDNEGPVLILVQKIDHGFNLQKRFKELGKNVTFLYGLDDNDTRTAAVKRLRSGKDHALIASTIYDEGIDIPEIKTLVLAGGGKSIIKGLQRIGRGLRLSQGKEFVMVIDFMDYVTNRLRVHSRARKTLWEKEKFELSIES